MPLVNKTFNQLIDFTRTSAATYVDATGKIVPTAASRNLLTFTQEFDNAGWVKNSSAVYPFDPATASYGPELITNGDFSGGTTGWTGSGSGGWLISGGVATHTAGTYGTLLTSYASTTTTGKVYVLTFDFAGTGGLNIYSRNALLGVVSGTGAKRIFFTAAATSGATLNFEDVAFNGTIDNISLKEVIGGLIAAPDGTLTADTLVADGANFTHLVRQTASAGFARTFSIYLKAGTNNFAQLYFDGDGAPWANFDLATGVVGSTGTNQTATITSVGNGWYRCAVTTTSLTATSPAVCIVTSASAGRIQANTLTTSIYLWGAQLEAVPDANLVLGSELASNGTFDTSMTGWSNSTGLASATVVSGVAQLTVSGLTTAAGVTQAPSLVVGKSYVVTGSVRSVSGAPVRISVTNNAFDVIIANSADVTSTSFTPIRLVFTATQTNNLIYLRVGAVNGVGEFDNISVKEITGTTGMPTDYTRNNGGVYPPRFDYDPVTLAPKGLLVEEQRTNLLLRSAEFDNASWSTAQAIITANATTAPDGTVSADKIVGSAVSAQHIVLQSQTTTGTLVVASVFAKAAELSQVHIRDGNAGVSSVFDISGGTVVSQGAGMVAAITSVGNGWYRCSVQFTSASGTQQILIGPAVGGALSYLGDGTSGIYIWGAQLEAGAFATSYIPTVASQVTRTADVATITGANFSQWFNAAEGSFVVEFMPYVSGNYTVVAATDGTANNRVHFIANSANQFIVSSGGAANIQALIDAGTINSGAINKIAGTYRVNDFAASTNNSAAVADIAGAVPNLSRLDIGSITSADYANGWLRSIRYYPTRLSNAQLQALTA